MDRMSSCGDRGAMVAAIPWMIEDENRDARWKKFMVSAGCRGEDVLLLLSMLSMLAMCDVVFFCRVGGGIVALVSCDVA